MSIVGGLDIHRSQITFDYPGTQTGEVGCGQVRPADRAHLREWLGRFAGQDGDFAMEGCTGWRYVAEEVAAAGLRPRVADPAELAALRGRRRHAKTDRADARLAREQLQAGRLPECWVPPPLILECRALLECYHDLRAGHTAWVQRIQAVLFHHGAPCLGGLSRAGAAERLAAAAAGLSPAGQAQIATALAMTAACEQRLGDIRRQVTAAARHLAGARELRRRLYGVGPATALALTCWPGGAGRFSSSRKAVRFTGLDVTVYSSAGKSAPPATCPGRGRRCCAGACMRPARPTPAPAPPATPATPKSRTAPTASAPPCPRPAGSPARPCTSWRNSATTRSRPADPRP